MPMGARQRSQITRTANCWLIDVGKAPGRSLVAQYAQLRQCALNLCSSPTDLPAIATPRMLIAIQGTQLNGLAPFFQAHMAALVRAGATLYVRGIDDSSTSLAPEPLPLASVRVAPKQAARAYLFSASPKVPRVLRQEIANFLVEVRSAEGLTSNAEVQLSVRHIDGVDRAVIFSSRYGRGEVIYDLHESWEGSGDSIIARLADPLRRPAEIGPLIALNQVSSDAEDQLAPFSLMIDDRPTHYDYFNIAALKSLLNHFAETCPGAHIDFAWTPAYSHPPRAYIDEIKRASCGFVWHGLFRHVDHAAIADSELELSLGRQAVAAIERRFSVYLQPIMVFPFERHVPAQLALLQRHRFLATVEVPRSVSANDLYPRHLSCSLPCRRDEESGSVVLYRHSAASLTRDRLLAMATIGLPIIAFAHPGELGLKRFDSVWKRKSRSSLFDEILKFARSKGLPSKSLEEIVVGAGLSSALSA